MAQANSIGESPSYNIPIVQFLSKVFHILSCTTINYTLQQGIGLHIQQHFSPASWCVSPSPKHLLLARVITPNIHVNRMARQLEGGVEMGDPDFFLWLQYTKGQNMYTHFNRG
jgi:hypothetical protein